MSARDGNGWVNCQCGQRHWGLFGAAGLLLTRTTHGTPQVLLQLRAAWTHHGGTWGIPGGARDSHETAAEAGLRECVEETLIDPKHAQVCDELVTTDHGDWSYTVVLAAATLPDPPMELTAESSALEWYDLPDVPALNLHPGVRSSWDTVAHWAATASTQLPVSHQLGEE